MFCRSHVQKATNGVSGAHQQRASTEALAYITFKRALLAGDVMIVR